MSRALAGVLVLTAAVAAHAGQAVVIQPNRHDVSPPLRSAPAPPQTSQPYQKPELQMPEGVNRLPQEWSGRVATSRSEHVLQTEHGRGTAVSIAVNAEGLGNGLAGYPASGPPPDTTGAAGADHYVQWVNLSFGVFDKTGTLLDQPGSDWRSGNALWSGFGGPCETTNNGDPVVLYDQLADRWVMSQLALPNWLLGPFYQCMAVSTTSDPLGTWVRAEYEWPSNRLNDYPKLGVWTDSYTITVNEFQGGSLAWRGAAVAAFDRAAFLAGGTPAMVYFDLGTAYGGLLPADLDGPTPPPDTTPPLFFGISDGFGADALQVWELDLDWSDPGSATVGGANNAPDTTVPVTSFSGLASAPQPGGANLDTLSDRLMFRAAYRNFGTHESVVLNHSVAVSGRNAVRWYELRDPAGTPVLWQEGTFAPDSEHRWMGSVAMDAEGNIALGYSVSSGATSPSIRVTGRLAGDPPGQMTLQETTVQAGTGYQTGSGRWGDYSTMSVDPVDDCVLWFTHEYAAGTSSTAWGSRVVALELPGCETVEPLFADGFESGDPTLWSAAVP